MSRRGERLARRASPLDFEPIRFGQAKPVIDSLPPCNLLGDWVAHYRRGVASIT
jgi:hypothetical protein